MRRPALVSMISMRSPMFALARVSQAIFDAAARLPKVVFFDVSADQLHRRCLHTGRRRAHGQRRFAGTVALLESAGIGEVALDGVLEVLVHADDPHHHEERHHGRHEVGIRDLPGTAVMTGVALRFLLDDDDGPIAALLCHAYAAFRVSASSSANVGRSTGSKLRRANSTHVIGESPRANASIAVRMQLM